MSTLNSHSDAIRSMLFKGEKIPESSVIDAGLDVELLRSLVSGLKSRMDYLRGYKSLDSFYENNKQAPGGRYQPFSTWLAESGLSGQYPQCLQLFRVTMQGTPCFQWFPLISSEKGRYEGEYDEQYHDYVQRYATQRVFLTRKGEWIVWASWPVSDFRVAEDLDSALQALRELTPQAVVSVKAACMKPGSLGWSEVSSPSLHMARQLMGIFRTSITEKTRQVEDDAILLERLRKPFDRFA